MPKRLPKAAQKAPDEIIEDLLRPAPFASKVLGINLYDWQRKVLADLEPRDCRVALRAANGSGKTSTVISAILIWHALTFQRSIAVTTAGVFRQVESQLWPSLRSHIAKLGGPWEVTSGEIRYLHPNGNTSRIIGYSATDPGRAEGWHAEDHDTAPLLMVVDEAKTVADPLFEAISRCQPTRLLIASSPGGSSGAFYRAFTKEANMWSKHAVTAFDCPHITQAQIDEVIQRYGEKHPLTRSMIYGEFVDIGNESLVINLTQLQACLTSPPDFKPGTRVAGVDFAAGGDANVLCVRDGNKVLPFISWRERDTMAAVGRFIVEFKKAGLQADNIYADASGLGMVMCDALAEAGWEVNRVNFGSSAYDNEAYTNRSAEMWYGMAKKIGDAEIILPDDDELTAQLTCRRTITNSKGKLGVESKDSMRSRGLASPDKADALALCLDGGNLRFDLTFPVEKPTWRSLQALMESSDPVMAGFDAGG
jgi:phage terminase large subunit